MNVPFQRRVIPEMMDWPDADPAQMAKVLEDLARWNRLGWGTGLMWESVRGVVNEDRSKRDWTLLDVATGGGDIPRSLVRWARSKKLNLRVTATDFHPLTLQFARERCREFSEIRVKEANLLAMPYPEKSFDIVTCSQALHHFHSDDIVTGLRQMWRVARRAVIVSDLIRSAIGYVFVWTTIRLGGGGQYARFDGPASIRNGFKPREMDWFARQAGLCERRILRHRGLRFSMTWIKGDAQRKQSE